MTTLTAPGADDPGRRKPDPQLTREAKVICELKSRRPDQRAVLISRVPNVRVDDPAGRFGPCGPCGAAREALLRHVPDAVYNRLQPDELDVLNTLANNAPGANATVWDVEASLVCAVAGFAAMDLIRLAGVLHRLERLDACAARMVTAHTGHVLLIVGPTSYTREVCQRAAAELMLTDQELSGGAA